MHKELWQVFHQNGEPIPDGGHPISYFDETTPRPISADAQIWLYCDRPTGRELLFQLRSKKVRSGNLWDVSAGGHIDYGETRLDTAVRETREELGVKVDPTKLQYIFSCHRPGHRHIHNVFLYDFSSHPDTFTPDKNEVADLKWVPLSSLDDFLASGVVKPNLATFDWYWQFLKLHLEAQ